jgi:hypothetical protein
MERAKEPRSVLEDAEVALEGQIARCSEELDLVPGKSWISHASLALVSNLALFFTPAQTHNAGIKD